MEWYNESNININMNTDSDTPTPLACGVDVCLKCFCLLVWSPCVKAPSLSKSEDVV